MLLSGGFSAFLLVSSVVFGFLRSRHSVFHLEMNLISSAVRGKLSLGQILWTATRLPHRTGRM